MSNSPSSASPRISRPAPAVQRVLAHGRYETRNTLRNGEQLLVTLRLAAAGAVRGPSIGSDQQRYRRTSTRTRTGVLALAVMASAFTGQGIATGFDRQYGVLAYLATTPLGPTGLILGKAVAVLSVIMVQLVVLGAAGLTLGWSPDPVGLVWLLMILVLGAAAFAALGLLLAGTVRRRGHPRSHQCRPGCCSALPAVAIFALDHQGPGVLLLLLPSAAMGKAAPRCRSRGCLRRHAVLILASSGRARGASCPPLVPVEIGVPMILKLPTRITRHQSAGLGDADLQYRHHRHRRCGPPHCLGPGLPAVAALHRRLLGQHTRDGDQRGPSSSKTGC